MLSAKHFAGHFEKSEDGMIAPKNYMYWINGKKFIPSSVATFNDN